MGAGGGGTSEERDVYDDLLRDTRGLRREHEQAREAWLEGLSVERKIEHLFELEILLKGLACFASPRNHPGPTRRGPIVGQDFREHASLVREVLGRIVQLCRVLLAERERAFVFQRYLETVLPDDHARTQPVRGVADAPAQALFVLRRGMTNLLEVSTGIARLPRVPFRLFHGLLALAQSEVSKNAYFNPLHALEFRPEFDRIGSAAMLHVVRAMRGDEVRRLVALTFLSLFRMLRYLGLAEAAVAESSESSKRSAGSVYVVLSVLRSDGRALATHLRRRAGPTLAAAFEADLFRGPAHNVAVTFDPLMARARELKELKATLEGLAANLQFELRRTVERDFPPLHRPPMTDDLGIAVRRFAMNFRPAIQNAIMVLGTALGAELDPRGVFDDETARRALSERSRRDVWMFAQILRAFTVKARSLTASNQDGWAGESPLAFVREFLAYFRAMGAPLLRTADYPRTEAFVAAMNGLCDTDMRDSDRLAIAVLEADEFHGFLVDLFEAIGERPELADSTFDRRGAAESLKLYLGD